MSSSAFTRLYFVRLFWNHTFTYKMEKFLDFCAKLVVLKLLLQFPVTRVLLSDQYLLCFMLCQIRNLKPIYIFFF